MIRKVEEWLNGLDTSQVVLWMVVVAVVTEIITCIGRFGIGFQSTRDTTFIGYLTFGIRIHHGYIGLVLLLIAAIRPDPIAWRNLTIIIGGSLVISDLAHHFLVLWPITGSPEFHFVYPSPTDD